MKQEKGRFVMFSKFNVWSIFPHHFATFSNRNKNIDWQSLCFYIIAPFCLPVLSYAYDYFINIELAGIAIGAFAIFGGLLFAIPVSLYEKFDKAHDKLLNAKKNGSGVLPYQKDFFENLVNLIKETYYNVTFCIVLCLLSIIFTALAVWSMKCYWSLVVFSLLSYYCYGLFFLTVLMITKRVYRIFEMRFKITSSDENT